jgi:Asp-tRNA(Asn)/Glu-tRNA(Gln) amidotransferase A subunit family amidase
LVTLRGSRHRIPLDGIFPGNPRDAVAGPLARTVTDLALLLDAMAATPGEHTAALARDALVGKRIGVVRALSKKTKEKYRFPFATKSPAVSEVWDLVLQDLERLGATVVEDVALPKLNARRRFGGWEQAVQEFLATTDPPMTFEELCDAGGYSSMIWPDAVTCRAELKKGLARSLEDPDPRYTQNAAWVQARMDKLQLDALLLPSDAHGVPRVRKGSPNCMLTSVTGLPSATVVGGWAGGLPVGMQLVGREGADLLVLGMAFAFEQGTGHRKAPVLVGPEQAHPLDLAASNLLHVALGQRSFEQVLHHGARKDLSAQAFADLAVEVLREAGQSHGVP